MPHLVGRRGPPKILVAVPKENGGNDRVAIDGHRHGTPKDGILKPGVLHRIDEWLAHLLTRRRLLNSVEVEPEEVRVEVRAQIVEREITRLLMLLIPPVVFWFGVIQTMQLARTKLQVRRVLVRNRKKHHFI